MSDQMKIVRTINQNRQIKSAINPKARNQSENVISYGTLNMQDRPLVIQTDSITGVAVWDDPAVIWDNTPEDEWDSFTSSPSTTHVINKGNLFVENFDFDFFKGTSTTATWNTTLHKATFTAGQVLYIQSAFKDPVITATSIIADVTIESGSFLIEASVDGGATWSTVTNTVYFVFTTPGTDLRLRITENGASTGEISRVQCSYEVL